MRKLLLIVIALELVGAGLLAARQLARRRAPSPDLRLVDEFTAADLRELGDRMDQRVRAGEATADDWAELADAYLASGMFPESELCYRRAAESEPAPFEVQYRWGLCLERLGQTGLAIERFREAMKAADEAQTSECWYRIARCHLRDENSAEAEAALREAGDSAPAVYQLARLLIRAGRVDEGVPAVEDLARRFPDAMEIEELQARVAEAQGDTPRAVAHRERAMRLAPGLQVDRYDEEIQPLRFVHGVDRRYQQVRQLVQDGEPDAALSLLHELMERDHPARDANMLFVARSDLQRGKSNSARALVEGLIDRVGESPEALEVLGDIEWTSGRLQPAITYWERAVRMRDVESLRQRLAAAHERAGEPELAAEQRALARQAAGVAAFWRNDLSGAKAALDECVGLDGSSAQAWFYLGEIEQLAGRWAAAREAYERCLSIDPGHGRVHVGLARLAVHVDDDESGR
jgi:tetratricopeptide (TPR) repeat protein